jgi:hypothetical protein
MDEDVILEVFTISYKKKVILKFSGLYYMNFRLNKAVMFIISN